MKRSTVVILAALAAVGLWLVPSLIPTGPTSSLDASGLLESGRLFVAAGVIFLGGLLTSLTPCVYPLIPITVGVFGARQAESRGKALLFTTAYVVGMGVVFSALGIFAAFSGKAFGSMLGNTWVLIGLAVFMLILASSMFGAFDLELPSSITTRLNNVGGGGFIGALLMGSVAGFLAAPCTGPVLTGVLTWVAQTKDPVLGGGLLFIYALGIGVPFFLIGVFTVQLPRSGAWMEWVKSLFGIALLALAVGYLRDAFPGLRDALSNAGKALGTTGAIVLGMVLAFAGVMIGAIHRSFKDGQQWLLKGIGVAAVLVAFVIRMAAPLPSAHVDTSASGTVALVPHQFEWALTFKADEAKTAEPFEAVLARAKADCKPVLIDFFADWCAACKELDAHTYVAPAVVAESQRFVRVKVDGTNEHDVLDVLYKKFGVKGLPTVAFIDPLGEVMASPKITGFLPPEKFLGEMQKVAVTTCSRSP